MSDRTLIREQVSVHAALEMLDLEPADHAGKICCPFHEEVTASCHVYDDHVHCFGCGFNGDVVWFVAKLTGQPLWRAEQFLLGLIDDVEADVKVQPVVHEVTDLSQLFYSEEAVVGPMMRDIARDLVAKRWPALTLEYIEGQYAVKVCRDGLWIPHFEYSQAVTDRGLEPMTRVVGIKVRTYKGGKTSVKGSTYRHPYGVIPSARWAPGSSAVLCEGEPDTWAMAHLWTPSFGLPTGVNSYTDQVHAYASQFKRIFLALDADDAGRKAAVNVAALLRADGVECVDLTPSFQGHGGDVCDALANGWVPDFSV